MNEKAHPLRLDSMQKDKLIDFNTAEARGWVIDRLRQIEYRIDEAIILFYAPNNKEHFKDYLLNSSILDFGSKLKILKNIGPIDNKTIDQLRKLSAIRNGFAHAKISEHITISVAITKEYKDEDTTLVVKSIISVMNSNGEIINKIAIEYLNEFLDLYNEVINKFNAHEKKMDSIPE